MTTTTPERVISRNCARGKHNRCLGSVAVFPVPEDGRALVPCECDDPACKHVPA